MRQITWLGLYAGIPAFTVAGSDILKPTSDYREFRHYQLSNGMHGLAIHHPKSTESGFAVATRTGSLYDPPEVPGLAHFLEHMLFLGTEKYPEAESYDSFLTENGGANNAYTDEEKTVFFNKVTDSALEEALARFSEFFKSPLFNREYEEKEVNAIDAEHQKNIPNDDERAWYTIRSLANGPMAHFSTGNIATLSTDPKAKGIDVVGKLREFYQSYYCAANMVAVTISPRSLDDQEYLVRQSFEGVSAGNKNWLGMVQCPGPEFNRVKPYDHSNTGKFVHLQSFSAEPSLWISFGLPPTLTSYKKQPISVLTYLLEYSGKGSISHRLKLLGLADGVSVTVDRNSISTLLGLKVDLTQKGATHRGVVLQEVFSYINFLRDHGISHELVSSLAEQSHVDFHTKQPGSSIMDDAARLAHNLLVYEPYHVVAGDFLLVDADPRLANELLQQMTPSKSVIAFSDPEFTATVDNFETEPYYGVQFRVLDLPQHHAIAMAVLTATPDSFKMPPPLLHIPVAEELQLIPGIQGLVEPILLSDGESNSGAAIWWQGQGSFAVPRVSVQLVGRIAKTNSDILSQMNCSVAMAAIAEMLKEETVDLQACGISHAISFGANTFTFSFEGYTANQVKTVMDIVSQRIGTLSTIEQERFERIKQRQIKLLSDSTLSMAFEHAMEAAAVLTRNDVFSRQDMINALQQTDFDDAVAKFGELKKIHADAFAMGNIKQDDVEEFVGSFIAQSGFELIDRDQTATSLAMEQKQPIEAVLANPIKGDKNHATMIQYQMGIPSIGDRVNFAVLSQFINRRLYDQLRTQSQLGYIVGARESSAGATELIQCFVEGAKQNPDEVEKLIEDELLKSKQAIEDMPDTELQKWKEATRGRLARVDVNFSEEFNRLWGEIFSHSQCFSKRSLESKYLDKEFSKETLSRAFAAMLEPAKKLAVKLVAGMDEKQNVTLIGSPQNEGKDRAVAPTKLLSLDEKDIATFQSDNGFFPDVAVCELQPEFLSLFEMMEDL